MATRTEVQGEFDPVLYSREELDWLLENIDKPVVVAMKALTPGINSNAVRPLLERLQELVSLEQHEDQKWVGFEAVKTAIRTYIEQDKKWEFEHNRRPKSVPRFPSLYSWDANGKGHLGGVGSDAGRVRTYFAPDGKRIPFAINLVPDYIPEWVPPVTETPGDLKLVEDAAMNRWECRVPTIEGKICGHTESYKEGSRSSRAAARARMSKHLRKATLNPEGHWEVHTNEFGGSDARKA
jgi:hypothetical protein